MILVVVVVVVAIINTYILPLLSDFQFLMMVEYFHHIADRTSYTVKDVSTI